MSRKYRHTETLPSFAPITAKLGAQSAPYKDTEIGKLVKKGTLDSQHILCSAVGDVIDGRILGVEAATADGFGIGTVGRVGAMSVLAEGSEAAGTGAIALGDQVVCGTPVAKDTGLGTTLPKVRKATMQVGTTAPADLAAVAAQLARSQYLWVVTSLGPVGTGAVGTEILIERIGGPAK